MIVKARAFATLCLLLMLFSAVSSFPSVKADAVDPFADVVVDVLRGSDICGRKWPQAALGAPNKTAFDICGYLGFIILQFSDMCLVDGPGADLRIVERSPPSLIEAAGIFISHNNDIYDYVGNATDQADSEYNAITSIDIGIPGIFHYVRVEDLMNTTEWPMESGGFDLDSIEVLNYEPCWLDVEVDIKPGSSPNSVNLNSHGVLPVGVISDESFNALGLDIEYTFLGPNAAVGTHESSHQEDLNQDDRMDAVFHFPVQSIGLSADMNELRLESFSPNGLWVRGCDTIRIVGR